MAEPQAPPAIMPPLLELRELSRRFGGVTAVDKLSLAVRAGETLGIIGPNGAGKSTLIALISGALEPSAGDLYWCGERITGLRADQRTRLGIGRTHQIPRPFARMSVYDNLALAARHARGIPPGERLRERCLQILARTGLADVAGVAAGSLPLLRRKRLELARALALRPRLLLLDEIGAGLIEAEIQSLIALIRELRAEVESMLLIEHVMQVIRACCERTAVLASGQLLTSGATREVLANAEVAAVYLGTSAQRSAVAGDAPAVARNGLPTPPQSHGETLTPPVTLLEVRHLAVNYGGVRALRGISLEVRAGETVALLGANGAGKSTLARAISGVAPIAAGEIRFAGQSLRNLPAERITALGLGHCMEGRRIFSSLSVEENLLLALPRTPRARRHERLERAYDMFPALRERRHDAGTAMSGGQQQMLAIARALMHEPRLVIFDEISLGLAPLAVDQLYEALARIRASGVALLLVEQSIERSLALADRACVLEHGELRLQGRPQDIRWSQALRALYVGDVT